MSDDRLDINLEASPSLGSEDKYEAKVGAPYEEDNAELPPVFPEEIKIPGGVSEKSPLNAVALLIILFAAANFIAAVALAFFGLYVGSAVCGGCFVFVLIAFFTVLSVREKIALSGKNVLGRDGTRRITATVKEVVLHSTTTKRIKSRGYPYSIKTGAVYKITLFAEDREFTAFSRTYYEKDRTVYAFVNGKNAYIDEDGST